MQAVPRTLADKFAQAFAGDKAGFSAKEITEYFSKYSNLVKPYDHYGMKPVRKDSFIDAVYVLTPKQQYYALNDLTWTDRASKYAYPSVDTRLRLREALHSFISPDPIGLRFSKLRETAFREDWVSCLTRFENDPAATITAARTLLETVPKTIISERGGTPDASGDLVRLLRQAQESVGFLRANDQATHQILSGLAGTVSGIACLSNKAGDRHGLVNGQSIDDAGVAWLCVNAAGTVGLAMIELHLFGWVYCSEDGEAAVTREEGV